MGLLGGERLFKHNNKPQSTFQKSTNFGPPRAILGIVILIEDETRILRFSLSSFLGGRLRGILLRLTRFIFTFSFLFPF